MIQKENTRESILNAAEVLFAEQGFAATSLRDITAHAKVNLAAVNYHFGSKDALIQEVFARRLAPLNQARMERLETLQARDRPPALEEILEAFIRPSLQLAGDETWGGAHFMRLLGRAYTEPSESLRGYIHGQYAEVLERFKAALTRALPDLAKVELYWRLHFLLGALSYTMAGTDIMRIVAACDLAERIDNEALLKRLIAFVAGGLRAPAPERLSAE